MPEVLLFGATGYTGRLTARALARRGADFVIAGRSRPKLEELAGATGDPEIRVAAVGDVDALTDALADVPVMITCVGPFAELGYTAVEAALRAKVNYIDSTGEGNFIGTLIENEMGAARDAGIAMAPAMGFDEVPADVAAKLATEGLNAVSLTLTYAVPSNASTGTLRTMMGIAGSKSRWLKDGRVVDVRIGEKHRWAPMPPPLGPKSSVSGPFAESRLAPLHIDLSTIETYMTVDPIQRVGLQLSGPFLPALGTSAARAIVEKMLERLPDGPSPEQRRKGKWTILAEARSGSKWRNVAISGTDVYGLTAEFLAAGALKMAKEGPLETGVVAPVQAVGIETFEKVFADHGVVVETYEVTKAS